MDDMARARDGRLFHQGADEHYAPVCWAHYDEATRALPAEVRDAATMRPS